MSRRLLFLVTEDWYFMSHRFQLACAAKVAGYDVGVITQLSKHEKEIRDAGLELYPIQFARSHSKPWQDLKTVFSIIRIYRDVKPDLVHHVAIKPVLYGSLARLFSPVPVVINALTGLGYIFSSAQPKARVLRKIISPILRFLLTRKHSWLILQNRDDHVVLQSNRSLNTNNTVIIRGSGVDVKRFNSVENKSDQKNLTVMLAARLLWDKGVGEFIEAAKQLKNTGVSARFVLVGETDAENPAAVDPATLASLKAEGIVEWWGRQEDMPEILNQADIFCLPSYREGLPKVLLEAGACGKALITTDAPGCREVVQDGENGLLVPVRDANALAEAIKKLIEDSQLREQMGQRAREKVLKDFTIEQVIDQTLALYARALADYDQAAS